MIGTLYFKRATGEKVLVKDNLEEENIGKAIKDAVFEMNPNYKIYYMRAWISTEDASTTVYDVGSHTEFFLYTKASGK